MKSKASHSTPSPRGKLSGSAARPENDGGRAQRGVQLAGSSVVANSSTGAVPHSGTHSISSAPQPPGLTARSACTPPSVHTYGCNAVSCSFVCSRHPIGSASNRTPFMSEITVFSAWAPLTSAWVMVSKEKKTNHAVSFEALS